MLDVIEGAISGEAEAEVEVQAHVEPGEAIKQVASIIEEEEADVVAELCALPWEMNGESSPAVDTVV